MGSRLFGKVHVSFITWRRSLQTRYPGSHADSQFLYSLDLWVQFFRLRVGHEHLYTQSTYFPGIYVWGVSHQSSVKKILKSKVRGHCFSTLALHQAHLGELSKDTGAQTGQSLMRTEQGPCCF